MNQTSLAAKTNTDKPAVQVLEHEGYAEIRLDKPERRNPLSFATMEAMVDALQGLAARPDIKAIILSSTGPAFSAGHDLKELTRARQETDKGLEFFTQTFALCAKLMLQMTRQPQPIIAAIESVATAAGCQLVATADLAVAGAEARFCTPGVNIGLFCSTPMVALTRNVSRKAAMEMLLLGEMISAERASELGLVNRVVPAGSALQEAEEIAKQITAKAARTVRRGKAAFYQQMELGLEDAYAEMAKTMTENMLDAAAEEGIDAFVSRRAPVWP